ncbi:hypothetical protein Cni_G22293 [Canna indica]|uniref:Uncharacterized protein n=1 Tax=Canna indica TaxID=4628 RepID=A0AAQ3KUW1_9LILI|nr:hypothetical protein Cni_G22293 [Canna indica]
MRSSYIVFSIFMMLVLSAAQGIHLEGKSHRSSNKESFHQNVEVKKSSTRRGSGAGLVLCRENKHYCSSSSPNKNHVEGIS